MTSHTLTITLVACLVGCNPPVAVVDDDSVWMKVQSADTPPPMSIPKRPCIANWTIG